VGWAGISAGGRLAGRRARAVVLLGRARAVALAPALVVLLARARVVVSSTRGDLAGRRLGASGGWVVAISGLAGLAVGAVSTTVYASAPSAHAREASATSSASATIPPIVAGGGAVVTTIESVETTLEPQSITQSDSSLPVGYTKVLSKGSPGLQLVLYSVTSVDGVETNRELLTGFVVKPPTHDVVSVGTLSAPAEPAVVPGSNRAIGQQLAASWGWTGAEWVCLDNLFQRESNWRELAGNPTSGAYGIPQALPGSKMASAGADWLTNPATQITWGLGYIKGRYGTPCGAWAASNNRSPHWY
jgi:hypothetical protein